MSAQPIPRASREQLAARAEAVAARRRFVALVRGLAASLVLVLIAAASRVAGLLPIGGTP